MGQTVHKPMVALVDHESESVSELLRIFRDATINTSERKRVIDTFDFVPVLVEPEPIDTLADRAFRAILEHCMCRPTLIIVDYAFANNETYDAGTVGRELALSLRNMFVQTPVGVYTKEDLKPFERAELTSDGLAVVLEKIVARVGGRPAMSGDQWSKLLQKFIPRSGDLLHKAVRGKSLAASDTTRRTASEIVAAMQPTEWPGVFVLGSFERRITFHSQQVRALTLIRALVESGELSAGNKVAIIGGGSAGVTAAVAARCGGCEVHLYEARDDVLHLQQGSGHRFLHPHIYKWPDTGSHDPDAGLPLLNWRAANANHVVSLLRQKLSRYAAIWGGPTLKMRTRIAQISKRNEQKRLTLFAKEGEGLGQFDVAIVAIGYGLDGNDRVSTPSYWSPDPISGVHDKEVRKILVSGTGDGGLVDVARAALQEFQHDETIRKLTSPEFARIGMEMQRVDDQAGSGLRDPNNRPNLYARYNEIEIDQSLIDRIKAMKRIDTEVTFNYRDVGVFTLESALINRLLVFLLIKAGIVLLRRGNIQTAGTQHVEDKWHVTFDTDAEISAEVFDLVVLRHGPPKDHFARQFPEIAVNCVEMGRRLTELGVSDALTPQTYDWYMRILHERDSS